MPNVTQSVTNYFGGISQQPDYEMKEGSLKDIKNAYPDITYGLRKRPGLRYEFTLGDSVDYAGAYWFSISQAELPPHIACIVPGGEVHVWNLFTQQKLTTTPGTDFSYLSTNDQPFTVLDRDSFTSLSVQNVTVILNRHCRVKESTVLTPGTLTSTVTLYSDLADLTPSEGDIVHILNSPVAEDDYYVLYTNGAWQETVKPGISDGIDDSSTAHVLVILPDGTFSFTSGGSVRRKVGDEVSNPQPSFVGSFLHNIFFYLNRVGYLSRDNVFLSQTLRPDNLATAIQQPNYYINSSLVVSDADPIDLNASTVRATTLNSVLPSVQGLVIFADNEQFMLYSEQGVITPRTALLKSISTFEMNPSVDAVQMGDEYYFISKTQRNTRVFQLVVRGINDSPILNDVSKLITDYIPNDVDILSSNSQNQFLSLSSSIDNKMYMYRMYKENNKVLFTAWYTWDLPGTINIVSYFDDRFFATLNVGDKICISSAALNLVPKEDLLTNLPIPDSDFPPGTREGIGPFLDLWLSSATPVAYTISPTTIEKTSKGVEYWVDPIVSFPESYPSTLDLIPCAVKTNVNLTRTISQTDTESGVGYTITPTINQDGTWTIKGKYRVDQNPSSWVVGYRFNYDLYLPQTYFRLKDETYDWSAYTSIDRYKFIFNEVSDLTFKVRRLGSEDWFDRQSVSLSNLYQEDTPPNISDFTLTVPIHQRNSFFDMRIFSDSPFPVTLSEMYWEGIYNPKYYKRY